MRVSRNTKSIINVLIIAKCGYAIILQRLNTCDNGIVNTCFGDIGDLLKYCPTLPPCSKDNNTNSLFTLGRVLWHHKIINT